MSVLTNIITGIFKPLGDYFSRRQEIKAEDRQQERAIKKALTERQIDLISQGLAADAQWETIMANQATSSYKDEYVLFVISIPAVLAFIPNTAIYVEQGFAALDKTPDYYKLILVSIFLATYGIRFWRRSQYDTA